MKNMTKIRDSFNRLMNDNSELGKAFFSYEMLFNGMKNTIEKVNGVIPNDYDIAKCIVDIMRSIDWSVYDSKMVQAGIQLMQLINAKGYEAYVVGGAVRDIIMGDTKINDIDIATNMPIDEIKKHFRVIEYNNGEAHGTVIVHYGSDNYELTQFRTEGTYSDKRRPDSVEYIESFEEDTKRRDFTINAMGIDSDGRIIDFHNGLYDIQKGVIRTVGDARERFSEDALRIIRAIRFSARFDFDICKLTTDAMCELKGNLTEIAIERIYDELTKTISYGGKKFAQAILRMRTLGIFSTIFPDVKVHSGTMDTIRKADSTDVALNFALLFLNYTGDIQELCRSLTFSGTQTKSVKYIYGGINQKIYENLDRISRSDALDLIENPNFEYLQKAYRAVFDTDIDNADQVINKIKTFTIVRDRSKQVNEMLLEFGFSGRDFGSANRIVMAWLYDNYEVKYVPSYMVLREYIDNLREYFKDFNKNEK